MWDTPSENTGPNFMALLTAEFGAFDHLNAYSNVEYATHKPQFPAYSSKTVDVSTELPVSISNDSSLKISRAMKLGPGL